MPFLDVTHETPTTSTAIDVNIECSEECVSSKNKIINFLNVI